MEIESYIYILLCLAFFAQSNVDEIHPCCYGHHVIIPYCGGVVTDNHVFTYSPIKGRRYYFQIWAINKATMNIPAHPSLWTGFHLL